MDVFASPSARQVYGTMKAFPSKMGTVLIITNCCVFLPFLICGGLFELTIEPEIQMTACISVLRVSRRERMELRTCDDVSVARSEGALFGGVALAGTILGTTVYSF